MVRNTVRFRETISYVSSEVIVLNAQLFLLLNRPLRPDYKEKLKPALDAANVHKTMATRVTAIIGITSNPL